MLAIQASPPPPPAPPPIVREARRAVARHQRGTPTVKVTIRSCERTGKRTVRCTLDYRQDPVKVYSKAHPERRDEPWQVRVVGWTYRLSVAAERRPSGRFRIRIARQIGAPTSPA